ncbi:protein MAIN-LIKE 1-like [Trifolium pratense]|uniref:protein MAIN-LIKE 1-like n=1 Tax=Trifolium pratense TaxID=57577 RepID=UPI001E6936C7|nr:protein MAIN-LIKE 1-like [Trifolium pratense]
MNIHTGTLSFMYSVARIRGRDGRIRRSEDLGHEEFLRRQAEEELVPEVPPVVQPVVWPGGPIDTSLLTRYHEHVARHVWFGEERHGPRIELKIASLGGKLAEWVPDQHSRYVEGWMTASGLRSLERTSLNKVDPNLISAFVERWHPETSSFHMSFGEMTITLDDVTCLLHIPIRGDFYTPSSFTEEEAAALAAELLGVNLQCAARETRKQRCGYFSQQWLFDNYIRQCDVENYDCAARSYLLLLVGCTICTDKSFTHVDAKYLPMFRVLSTCGRFAWGAIALVELYDTLNDASIFTTKGLAGYATLLQCWIHEYFPTLGRRAESGLDCDIPGASLPRARRWRYRQGNVKLPTYRPVLDALTPDDVIWRSFQDHRAALPFDLVSMYSGYLRGCTVVRYLPERCIRQFGYVQYIPPPPPPAPAIDVIDSDWIGYDIAVDRIVQPTRPATYAAEAAADYLLWYYMVSHPIVCRPVDGPHGAQPVPQYMAAQDDPIEEDAPAPAEDDLQRERRWRGMIGSTLERFVSRLDVDRDEEGFEDLFLALDVARGEHP